MEENDEVLNTAKHGDWTPEYESLIKEIKKKREEIKRKRDNPLGMDLVSVQPLSAPINMNYLDFIYEDSKAKYKKRKKVIDKLLGKEEEKEEHLTILNGELSHPDNTNFTIDVKENESSNVYNVMSKWSSLIDSVTKDEHKKSWLNDYVNQHAKYENGSSGFGA